MNCCSPAPVLQSILRKCLLTRKGVLGQAVLSRGEGGMLARKRAMSDGSHSEAPPLDARAHLQKLFEQERAERLVLLGKYQTDAQAQALARKGLPPQTPCAMTAAGEPCSSLYASLCFLASDSLLRRQGFPPLTHARCTRILTHTGSSK